MDQTNFPDCHAHVFALLYNKQELQLRDKRRLKIQRHRAWPPSMSAPLSGQVCFRPDGAVIQVDSSEKINEMLPPTKLPLAKSSQNE